jgi:2-dehydropantoate 2-reductase
MKICVFGAGAIGGVAAARMALAGSEVSVVARGAHLAAIRRDGLILQDKTGRRRAPVRATDDPATLGHQDVVVIGLKAHGFAAAADAMRALIGPETVLVPAQNGIPWWYFHRHGGPHDGAVLDSVDPGGRLARLLPPDHALGCVVYLAASVPEPGIIDHSSGERFILGEPDGAMSARLERVGALFRAAGFTVETTDRIRDAVWVKLWGNLSMNPLSVLTLATMDRMLADPLVLPVCREIMREAQAVGERLGIRFGSTIDQRLDAARSLGAFKTSMLQDLEAGRPIEIDALVGAVSELGRRVGVATPLIDAIYALARLRGAAFPLPLREREGTIASAMGG